jgi:uncharacterized membrane protein
MSILVILATFLAAGVEWVEALTIVLAVGLVKGWRSAFTGTIAAVVALVALVAAFGLAITSHISIDAARTVVGVFSCCSVSSGCTRQCFVRADSGRCTMRHRSSRRPR